MVVAIHKPGDVMYLIRDPQRRGLLTWDHDNRRYVMAFTTSDKAEEYNAIVLKHQPGEVVRIRKEDSRGFAKRMVSSGVYEMIIDYPVINDQDFWDKHPFEIGNVPTEVGRNYSIVDFRVVLKES